MAAEDAAETAFERAVLAVIDGDAEGLMRLLREQRQLATDRGAAPYRATLLHYVAANGVEDALQRTPPNAVEIARLLLVAGAEPDATAETYGGGTRQTPLCLLASSWHPFAAGVAPQLVRTLCAAGAAVEGLENDGAPLSTALTFGYGTIAAALVAAGARAEALQLAAGVGDREQVEFWFSPSGALRDGASQGYTPAFDRSEELDAAAAVQEALHFAVTHGQVEIAGFLLERGARANGTTPGHHCALPLNQALFVRQLACIPLLLEQGANPDLVDPKRGVSARSMAGEPSAPPNAAALFPDPE